MGTVRSAIYWNLVSAPVRIGLGLAQTALLARLLYGEDGSPLAAFALIGSGIVTAVLFTSLGTPQLFSRIAADYISSGRLEILRPFSLATAMIRVTTWALLATISTAIIWLRPTVLPVAVQLPLSDPALLALCMLWGLSYDLAGLSGRLLSANLEQKWQNLVNVASQAFGIAIIAVGFWQPSHSIHFAVAGMAGTYILRLCGHAKVLAPTLRGWRGSRIHDGFGIWRSEFAQLGHVSLEKAAAYALSPHFYLLLAGYVVGPKSLAALFLLFDFAAKLLTVVAVPINGLVLPAVARANAKGQARLAQAIRDGMALTRATGVTASFLIGAGSVPLGQLLYGRPFGWDAALLCLVLGVVVSEFMVHELAGSYLVVKRNAQRLWGLKFAVAAISIATGGIAWVTDMTPSHILAALFGARLTLLIAPLFGAGLGNTESLRGLVLVLGILLASALGYVFYPPDRHWHVIDVVQASLTAGLGISVCVLTLLRPEFQVALRYFRRPWSRLQANSLDTN